MKFKCHNCHSILSIPYYFVGSSIDCPKCHSIISSKLFDFLSWENTGHEITYEDFVKLISYEPYAKIICPVLESWYECKIMNDETGTLIFDLDQNLLLPFVIHISIQNDKKKRYHMYQLAMTLWR
jgi:F0F1-type ATP synthase gamma subunit